MKITIKQSVDVDKDIIELLQMRTKQIAEAFQRIAVANHYMVGFIGPATLKELEQAKQILIIEEVDRPNAINKLALDLLEAEIKGHKF